ncbi:MAG: hypothetical protein Q7T87_16900 [Polaromonas sp.]|nr:hypothetical protein [Polaromonas sp.]
MTDLTDFALFFECNPSVRPSDVPWDYSGATFFFETTEDTVHCRLAPGEGQISLVWHQRGLKQVEVSLEWYFDVKLERLADRDRLGAIGNRDDLPPLVVQLRPNVFIALGSVAQLS